MKSLRLKRLTILSDSTESANQFVFHRRLNLITAEENSVGKSTLVKLVFWALGCEPAFDSTWTALNVKASLLFEIDNNVYKVIREGNMITLKAADGPIEEFSKITGAYSERISGILGFNVLLPNKQTAILETPPPAYYFLPFYIEQKRGWVKPWDNFEKLEQYGNWKGIVTKYHVGLLTPDYFEKQVDISNANVEKSDLEVEVNKIDITLAIVGSFLTRTNAVVSDEKLSIIKDELEVELKKLTELQESTFDSLYRYENEVAFLSQQLILAQKVVKEYEADYVFSVENLPQDEIVCPFCGTHQDNSIVSRASILVDKAKAEDLETEISAAYSTAKTKLDNAKKELEKIQDQIETLNAKYSIDEEDTHTSIENISQAIGAKSISESITAQKAGFTVHLHNVKKAIKQLKTEQKALVSKETIDIINSQFMLLLLSNLKELNAQSVNLTDVTSPLDYKKIFNAGGAAENTRSVLAYFLAIYKLISTFGSEVVAPLVIDTPNQHEQSIGNYDSIVKLLMSGVGSDAQIILCAMDNEQLSLYKAEANIITLSSEKLLLASRYEELQEEFILQK